MDFGFILNSAVLGIGLAMDAFSVSMANGLHEPSMRPERELGVSGTYAAFQFLMPLLGWFCVHNAACRFAVIRPLIPWISLLLLLYIGGTLLTEGLRRKAETDAPDCRLSLRFLLLQGIATSIDALSVGFTIASYHTAMALLASFIIAAVTWLLCFSGIRLGKRCSLLLADRAGIFGGLLLIGIGVKIFLRG